MEYIYVQSKYSTPLMPTKRFGKVRRMLRDRRAVIVSYTPFTVKLTYDTVNYVQPVRLGVDAGTKHIGISATTTKKEVYAAEVNLRTDIVNNLSTRREARRSRRGKRSIRYRAPRFNNRVSTKKCGWFAPSVNQKIQAHVNIVKNICKILPVTEVTVEVAQFDTQKLQNPNIAGTDYQQGPQLGFWNVREYVLFRDNHECQHCHGASKDVILNVHHLESRKTGGDSPANLITLCNTCHKAYHKGEIHITMHRTSQSLRDVAVMSIMRWHVYKQLQAAVTLPVHLTYGYITKNTRILHKLEKTHAVDARCISGNPTATPTEGIFNYRQLRRHNRKVMKSNRISGGKWKRNQALREVYGFRLFDIVKYKNTVAHINSRRTSGFFVVKSVDCNTSKKETSYKNLKLLQHNNSFLVNYLRRNRIE